MIVPEHGGQLRRIAEAAGVRANDLLDFSANINPKGPPAGVLARLRAALEEPGTLTRYPELDLHDLRAALARHLVVPPESLAIANGFVPLLEAVVRARGIRRCLLPVPCFGEYRRVLKGCGAQAIALPLQTGGFLYDAEALVTAAQAAGADAILLGNPQNPTGLVADRATMLRLVDLAGAAGVQMLLDEAFIDYCPAESITPEATRLDRLTVFRSVTKFYAMPGLRVAYAVASPARTAAVALPPWPVSTLAALAVEAALEDEAYAVSSRALNAERRDWLAAALRALGIGVLPGAANFLLLELPVAAALLRERLLREHGIVVRSCANFEGLAGEFLRVAVRTESENQRLVEATTAKLGG